MDFGDIFNDFFNSGRRSGPGQQGRGGMQVEDVRVRMNVSFMQTVTGGKMPLRYEAMEPCNSCKGTGARNGKLKACKACNGHGEVSMDLGGFGFGRMTCTACRGTGQGAPEAPCGSCRGARLERVVHEMDVDIPVGVNNGHVLMVSNNKRGGGRVLVEVHVEPHKDFKREPGSADIKTHVEVDLVDAILGGDVRVPTIKADGHVNIKVRPGTQDGTRQVISGYGFPLEPRQTLQKNAKRGDQIVEFGIRIPNGDRDLTDEMVKALQNMRAQRRQSRKA